MAREAVRQPLSPSVLQRIDAWRSAPVLEDWPAEPPYRRTFTLLAQHGWVDGSFPVGVLELQRSETDRRTGLFELSVRQKRAGNTLREHLIDATLTCREDALATPVRWELESRFTVARQRELPRLTYRESGCLTDGRLEVRIDGRPARRDVGPAYTCDWSLLDAVGRLRQAAMTPVSFDVLQDMTLVKRGQTLTFREDRNDRLGDASPPLRCFVQQGPGNLPYEYWVDDEGRPACVVNAFHAWLLDDEAPRRFDDQLIRLGAR